MKEPNKIKLTETPSTKDIKKIPLPPLYKQEWNIGQDNDDIYIPVKNLEKNNEDNPENNSQSIQ